MSTNLPANHVVSPISTVLADIDEEFLKVIQADKASEAGLRNSSGLPPFKRLKMPKQGGKYFEMPVQGQVLSFPYFIGQILHMHNFRQRWVNGALTCQSDDSVMSRISGVEFPGMKCDICPKSQFVNKMKPECARKTRIYMLPMVFNPMDPSRAYDHAYYEENGEIKFKHENVSEPIYLDVPSGSLKAIQDFMKDCDTFVPGYSFAAKNVIAVFECQEARNAQGNVYAKLIIKPSMPINKLGFRVREMLKEKYDLEHVAVVAETDEADHSHQQAPATPTTPPQFVHPAQQAAPMAQPMAQQAAPMAQPMAQPAPQAAPQNNFFNSMPQQPAQAPQAMPAQQPMQQPAQNIPNPPMPSWVMPKK